MSRTGAYLRKKYGLAWVPLLLLLALVAARVFFSDAFEEFSLKVFDRFQRLKPRTVSDAPVVIADLDDESLKRLGQWPWPRTQVAKMIELLHEAGAGAIALDIVFAEPDRTSPKNLIALWKQDVNAAGLADLPDHDEVFAQALAQAPVVIGFVLTSASEDAEPPLAKAGFAYAGHDPKPFLPRFEGAVKNLPLFEKAARGNGSFSFTAEADGIIRRVPLVFRYKETLYPSLCAEALRVAQGASTYVIKSSDSSGEGSFGEATGIVSVKIGSFVAPTDGQGRLWLYDSGRSAKRAFPLWRIFEEGFDPALVSGKIVFVGASAAGLKDLRATPLSPVTSGTEVHAQLAEQILTGEYLRRPDWAPGAELLYVVALGFLLILLLPLVGAALCAVLGLAAVAAVFFFSWHAFITHRMLFDPVSPSLACLLIYTTVSLFNYLREEGDRRHIRSAFGLYLAPELVEHLAHHPGLLKLGGEEKTMTVLFADIRGFTVIAEALNAQELTRLMNRLLTPATEIILKHRGTIDKYIGDCIMAFWNAPLDDAAHAAHGCRAALEIDFFLQNWNRAMKDECARAGKPHHEIRLGMGLNSGRVCVGNLGSDHRFNYSVMGDEVNLASRLEALTKVYGVGILVGPETYEAVKDAMALVEIDLIQVHGKTRPARIYALLGDSVYKERAEFRTWAGSHEKMLAAYRSRDWENAQRRLDECRKADPSETLGVFYSLFAKRLEAFRAQPPSLDWNGVFVAASK